MKVEKSGVDTDARWFNSTHARYKEIAKMYTQNIMEAIAYNFVLRIDVLKIDETSN